MYLKRPEIHFCIARQTKISKINIMILNFYGFTSWNKNKVALTVHVSSKFLNLKNIQFIFNYGTKLFVFFNQRVTANSIE